MTSLALVRVCNRGMMGSDFSLLLFFKAGVKQRLFLFFPCCSRALSGCSERGLPRGSRASPGSGISCCGAQALGPRASALAALRLSTCGTWA